MEKASGVNLEAKSGAGVLKAVRVVLPTPATLLEPVVLALAFPLDHFSNVERGESAAWLTACPPYDFTQASCSGEDTPRFRSCYHGLSRLKDAYAMLEWKWALVVLQLVVTHIPDSILVLFWTQAPFHALYCMYHMCKEWGRSKSYFLSTFQCFPQKRYPGRSII